MGFFQIFFGLGVALLVIDSKKFTGIAKDLIVELIPIGEKALTLLIIVAVILFVKSKI